MSDIEDIPQRGLTIAAVERDTRIGKDTLRVWERRYGFPQPVRDARGERLYPPDQVERLRHIKRLLDAGQRPGRVVPMPLAELLRNTEAQALLGTTPPTTESEAPLPMLLTPEMPASQELQQLLQLLLAHDTQALRRQLTQSLLRRGIGRFVTEIAAPLMTEVGLGWARGQIEVFEEHLCSEVMETVLRAALSSAPAPEADSRPKVVLTTFPDEPHSLGLLMADSLFNVEGCACMNLGRQTPMRDLLLATRAHDADIVALSFTACNNPNQVIDGLSELRRNLDPAVEIWAGASQPSLLRRGCEGVLMYNSLAAISIEVARWRHAHD